MQLSRDAGQLSQMRIMCLFNVSCVTTPAVNVLNQTQNSVTCKFHSHVKFVSITMNTVSVFQ